MYHGTRRVYYIFDNIVDVAAWQIQQRTLEATLQYGGKAKTLTTVARSFLIPFPTVHNARDRDERGQECLPRCVAEYDDRFSLPYSLPLFLRTVSCPLYFSGDPWKTREGPLPAARTFRKRGRG